MKTRRLGLALVLGLSSIGLFATGLPAGGDSPSAKELPAKLDAMSANAWQVSLLTAFGTFTYEDTGLASPFSRYLEDELTAAISQSSRLRLFNRNVAAAMDESFRAVYGDFFKNNSVDALLSGRYYVEGRNVRTRLELTGLSDGVLLGTADFTIPRSSVPEGLAIGPSAVASATASSLGSISEDSGKGSLKVAVSTERGPGAVYREGEKMVVLVTVNKSAWLKVYHIDASGVLRLIWPNAFTPGRRLDPGSVVKIPGDDDAFAFNMTPPFGTEFIKVVASTQPFASSEEPMAGEAFAELGTDFRKAIARGIQVAASGKAERSEAMASYVIIGD